MQQIKSYWRVVAVVGVVGALVGSACTVTTSSDDSVAGAGGTAGTTTVTAGTAGTTTAVAGSSSIAGTSSGGTSGVAGSSATAGSGPVPFQCDPATDDGGPPPGTPNTCMPQDPNDMCQTCTQAHCCTEYSQCYATDPGNECGWGGPNNEGEIICVQQCIQAATGDGGPDDADLRTMCFANCATTTANHGSQECGLIGNQTNALFGCWSDNCATECLGG